MSPEQQRIAIAEACGWTAWCNYGNGHIRAFPKGLPTAYNCHRSEIPDYLNSLDAMHEAEKVLNAVRRVQYSNELRRLIIHRSPIVSCDEYELIHATAAQRAEAFLRCIGSWQD